MLKAIRVIDASGNAFTVWVRSPAAIAEEYRLSIVLQALLIEGSNGNLATLRRDHAHPKCSSIRTACAACGNRICADDNRDVIRRYPGRFNGCCAGCTDQRYQHSERFKTHDDKRRRRPVHPHEFAARTI